MLVGVRARRVRRQRERCRRLANRFRFRRRRRWDLRGLAVRRRHGDGPDRVPPRSRELSRFRTRFTNPSRCSARRSIATRTKHSGSRRLMFAGQVPRGLAAALVLSATVSLCSCGDAEVEDGARITGFAFVDSSVTGQGSGAQLPDNAKIFPPGARVSGTEGCPSSAFRTDGLIVAVIDYRGRPTAGSVTVNVVPAPQFGGRPVLPRPRYGPHAAVSRPGARQRHVSRDARLLPR